LPCRGPLPRFGEVHIEKALQVLFESGRLSREELSRRIGVGEGSVRTILKILKRRGLVRSTKAGHFLTQKGRRAIGTLEGATEVPTSGLTVGKANVAMVIRNSSHLVRKGIEQRDEAIKVGAKGATVLVYRGGRLRFPDQFMEVSQEAETELLKKFKLKEGDVVIIGTADDLRLAEAGARAAARTIFRLP